MKILSNMRLGKKIALSMAAMVGLLIGITLLSLWTMHRISAAGEAAEQSLRMSQAQEVHMRVVRATMHVGNALVMVSNAANGGRGATVRCDACHDARDKSSLTEPVEKDGQEFSRIVHLLKEAANTEQEKSLVSAVDRNSEAVKAANAEAMGLWKQGKIGKLGLRS